MPPAPPDDPPIVNIHTDGSCLGNPGPGGYGVVLDYNGRRKQFSAGYALTTNNRMELLAAIVGLEALHRPCKVGTVLAFALGFPLRGGRHQQGLGNPLAP